MIHSGPPQFVTMSSDAHTSSSRISELVAEHEAQRQEDMLALQEKEKRITELEEKLDLKAKEEQKLELQRKVC